MRRAGTEDCDFSRHHGMSGNHSRNTASPISEMGRNFQAARSAHTHTLDSVEQTADERATIDPDFCDQRLAAVVEVGNAVA
jgi:hypothetical protein